MCMMCIQVFTLFNYASKEINRQDFLIEDDTNAFIQNICTSIDAMQKEKSQSSLYITATFN